MSTLAAPSSARPALRASLFPAAMSCLLALGLIGTLVANLLFPAWRMANPQLHSVLEAAGAMTALTLAYTLISAPMRAPELQDWLMVAALVTMGLLDLAHAASADNNAAVWLRSVSSLSGGLLFALVWLPPQPAPALRRAQRLTLGLVLAGALVLLDIGSQLPMLRGERFTDCAKLMNIAGGLLFLLASLRHWQLYRQHGQAERLLNMYFCLLFGLAALLFPYSSLWGLDWWCWHGMRLAAYAVVLSNFLLYVRRAHQGLELLVEERTAAWREAADAALSASNAKSLFLSNMSHELRTPMNAIIGFSALMQRSPPGGAELRQNLAIIQRSGEHLLSLINDVLDMAKIEAGRITVEHRAFDLHALLRELQDLMRERAEAKGLALRLELASAVPRCLRGDERKLRQVLINLLGNAIKFTDHGGVVLRLTTQAAEAGARLRIEVEDSGHGIASHELGQIFAPFIQAGPPASQNGTGLGLTLSRQFVHLMGGEIGVHSTLGHGSLFWLDLPLEAADAAELPAPHGPARRVLRLAPEQPPCRILVAEDQPDNALLITRQLESAGFAVEVAADGAAAVAAFTRWRPQLIWMDRRMPGLDGMAACRQIRALPGGDQVVVVGLTASILDDERSALLAAGMDDVVSKPYHEQQLFDCMAALLGVRYLYETAPPVSPAGGAEAGLGRLAEAEPAWRVRFRDALYALDEPTLAALLAELAQRDAALSVLLTRHIAQANHSPLLQALAATTGAPP